MKKPLSILIIDDDDDDKQMFCEVLSEIDRDISCISSANGQDALQLLRQKITPPDFIFLDLNMPRMSGKQCLVHIKQIEILASVPIIIYSTSKLVEDREETMRLGADYFLTKPSSMQHLKKELQYIFEKGYQKIMSREQSA